MKRYVQIDPTPVHVFPFVFLRVHSQPVDITAEARKWCHEQFGTDPRFIRNDVKKGKKKWDEERFGPKPEGVVRVRWRVTSTRAKFLDEDAAFAFRMRWC